MVSLSTVAVRLAPNCCRFLMIPKAVESAVPFPAAHLRKCDSPGSSLGSNLDPALQINTSTKSFCIIKLIYTVQTLHKLGTHRQSQSQV